MIFLVKKMKRSALLVVALLMVGGAGAAGYTPAKEYWKKRNQPVWKTSKVVRGDVISVVNATGTIKPVLSVQIGSFVSGPIEELYVDFNQEVAKGELLAKIDARIYDAAMKRDQATLATRHAELKRVKALLQQAENDSARARALREENEDYISDAEMDQFKYNLLSIEAQVEVATASIEQAEANLANSVASFEYTEIRSPVAGIIIDRKIDPGQTLAAQFQTPELFVVAPQMREKMHVFAAVDEADIGLIRVAQETGQPVHFTVDAYPDDLFEGEIEEIRFSSTELQNVVTYPVVVAARNPDLKLLPGMTASISFQVEQRESVLRIPNAALRYYPEVKFVREEDKKILEGNDWEKDDESDVPLSATEKAEARRKRNSRHVWTVDGDKLRAIMVEMGLSDSKYTEAVTGELDEKQELVIGAEVKGGFGS
jgi:HlyD family secretion protein